MILIADSGSTKTDWLLAEADCTVIERLQTEGINPFHQTEEQIASILSTLCVDPVEAVFFYGSGLRPEFRQTMKQMIATAFGLQMESVEAESDLLGAARALCGRNEGIACILGTGANSCLYDGQQIVGNTPPLGYILGDEGSGAVIGRNFLNAIYKGSLSKALKEVFESEYHITMADVIRRVYREPMANRWLASLSIFIYSQLSHYPELELMVVDSLRQFLRCNVAPYRRNDLPVSAIGSIAWYYQAQLERAADLEGMRLGRVERSPMDGLLAFHAGG